jgi:hypothetical protein
MSMSYIRDRYNVPAKRGRMVEIYYRHASGWRLAKRGRIASASNYIHVDGLPFHPTQNVVYYGDDGVTVLKDTRDGFAETAAYRNVPPGYSLHDDNDQNVWWSLNGEYCKNNYSCYQSANEAAWEDFISKQTEPPDGCLVFPFTGSTLGEEGWQWSFVNDEGSSEVYGVIYRAGADGRVLAVQAAWWEHRCQLSS